MGDQKEQISIPDPSSDTPTSRIKKAQRKKREAAAALRLQLARRESESRGEPAPIANYEDFNISDMEDGAGNPEEEEIMMELGMTNALMHETESIYDLEKQHVLEGDDGASSASGEEFVEEEEIVEEVEEEVVAVGEEEGM